PWLDFYAAESVLAQEGYEEADRLLRRAMAKPLADDVRDRFRALRIEALVLGGKVLSAYQSTGPKDRTFREVAEFCSNYGDFAGLDALLAARAVDDADDPELHFWRAESLWTKEDYAGLVRHLSENRRALFGLSENGGREWFADRMVRAAARLGKFDKALKEAAVDDANEPFLRLLVLAKKGDAAGARAAAAECETLGDDPAAWYVDDDVGPALRDPRLTEFRRHYPDPDANPAPPPEVALLLVKNAGFDPGPLLKAMESALRERYGAAAVRRAGAKKDDADDEKTADRSYLLELPERTLVVSFRPRPFWAIPELTALDVVDPELKRLVRASNAVVSVRLLGLVDDEATPDDERDVARLAALLAKLPETAPTALFAPHAGLLAPTGKAALDALEGDEPFAGLGHDRLPTNKELDPGDPGVELAAQEARR
ncbi:MAG: hypothetical protein ACRDD1_11515, partial [Planctomycetia bacterium]